MAEKNTFIMFHDWADFVEPMTDEQAGQLLKAIFKHSAGEELEIEDPYVAGIVNFIIKQIDKIGRAHV